MSLEIIYDGIINYIKDNIETYLDALKSDNIDLPLYKRYIKNSIFDVQGNTIYPLMAMEYGRGTIERETTQSDRYLIPITFYSVSVGGDAEALVITSERYVWALRTMFQADPTLSGLVDYVNVQGFEFSPAIKKTNTISTTGVLYTVFDTLIERK